MGSNLTPGRHTLNVKARDAGGNEGEQSHSWLVGKCFLLYSEHFLSHANQLWSPVEN